MLGGDLNQVLFGIRCKFSVLRDRAAIYMVIHDINLVVIC